MVDDLRDESDHENPDPSGDCAAFQPRGYGSGDEPPLCYHRSGKKELSKYTSNMIGLDGRPAVKNLLEILSEWLVFRRDTVRRRLNYRLEKVLSACISSKVCWWRFSISTSD